MTGQVWRVGRGRELRFGRTRLMGVVNVTPDSFSDGGSFQRAEEAVEHGVELARQGAEILDIGGESTRPGASPVGMQEEIRRVAPVITGLRERLGAEMLLSVDTCKAGVARAALDAGADIVNDVTGLLGDPGMMPLVAERDCGVVVMHMQGRPQTMQMAPSYHDVVAEVGEFLRHRLERMAAAGIDPERVVLDPGIGFGKTLDHNLELLRGLATLRQRGRPILVGVSRKSMIGTLLGGAPVDQRLWGTVALSAWLCAAGVELVRVHDVRESADAVRMMEAILHRPAATGVGS